MTKKSYNRMRKDAAKKEIIDANESMEKYFETNKGWDEAEDVYVESARMIAGTGDIIRQAFSDKSLYPHFTKDETIAVNAAIKGMQNDLNVFAEKLVKIHDLHKDKKGNVKDEDEFTVILNIVDQYSQLSSDFSNIVTPNHKFLVNKIAVAIERRDSKDKQETIEGTEVKEIINETKDAPAPAVQEPVTSVVAPAAKAE